LHAATSSRASIACVSGGRLKKSFIAAVSSWSRTPESISSAYASMSGSSR